MKPIQSSLALAAMLAAISPLAAQDQNSEVIQVSPDMFLRWYGHAGRTYFVQISDPNDHLRKWIWAPIIETGNDEDISYEVDGTADKGFFRLWFTDEPTTDPDGGDFDGDGLSNLAEVTIHQTNPLNPDTDGDGMPDGWEVFYALNPLDAADGNLDPDNDGLTNAQEYQHGTNPNLGDTDGDGVTDGGEVDEGTDPTDPLDTPEAEWVILTGDLDEDDEATKSRINGDRFLVRNPSWSDYDGDTRLWSSDWWSLFATNDGRYDLKWRGRFGTLSTHTNPHNYYSKGEEVLMKGDGSEPSAILEVTIKKELAWIKQEMGKGSLLKKVTAGVHTANGGWAFNGFWNGNPPATNPPLIANPYFKPFSEFFDENGQNPQTVHGATGSNLASQFALRAFMLTHDVPAVSNPAGSDFIDFNNNNVNDDAAKNTDMMGKRSGGWGGDWKRSDLKNQKIDRVFELYDDMATKGISKNNYMNTNTTYLSSLVFLIFFHVGNAQEPIDYDPWGKGIVTEEEANIIEKTHHFPITVEVTVVDESGIPLKGARCNVGIDSRLHMDGFNTFIGKIDENGKFTVNARGTGASEILVEMDGYYPSRPRFNIVIGKNNNIERIQKFGLEPCKGTASAMIRKVGKPIPMIVRWPNEMAQVDFPDNTKGEGLRWDILKAEWLPPHGKGEHGDLILSFNEDNGGVNIGNDGPQFYWHELNLKFANEHDGFFPIEELHGADSMLNFPRIAPEEGYTVEEMTIRTEFIEPRISYSGNKSKYGYLMRFRTEVDDDGKVVRGLYGKVTKPIEPGRSFNFHSYINPNWNDRNLEYDQTTNLPPELPERCKGVTWPP